MPDINPVIAQCPLKLEQNTAGAFTQAIGHRRIPHRVMATKIRRLPSTIPGDPVLCLGAMVFMVGIFFAPANNGSAFANVRAELRK